MAAKKPSKSPQKTSNPFERIARWADRVQQRHHVFSFPFAVIKKYGEENAGHQAALITYYGFLSLFPLLLVATSVVDIFAQNNPQLKEQLTNTINDYIPVIGEGLQKSIHTPTASGWALLLGLLFAFYGARGIADAVRNVLDYAWIVPRAKRKGFPLNMLKSFAVLLGAGVGLILTTTLSGYATAAIGNAIGYRVIPLAINALLLYLIFMFVFKVGSSRPRKRSELRLGAIVASVGVLVLQVLGTYLMTRHLHTLTGLYGQFALVLALMFWIYLQAQVFVYAIEINVVHSYKLWPRSLVQPPLTMADQQAFRLYAEREAYRPGSEQTVKVTFNEPK